MGVGGGGGGGGGGCRKTYSIFQEKLGLRLSNFILQNLS